MRHPNAPPAGHPPDEEIVDRVKAGLRNARTKGKRPRRPRKILDTKRVAARRAQGVGWKRIVAEMGVGVGTIYRVNLATRSELLPKAWVHV